jgi:hypothetical protein
MKNIICYKKGCNNRAQWIIPGRQTIHLCTKHMRELFPNQNLTVQRVAPFPVVGPMEHKDLEDDDGRETRTA